MKTASNELDKNNVLWDGRMCQYVKDCKKELKLDEQKGQAFDLVWERETKKQGIICVEIYADKCENSHYDVKFQRQKKSTLKKRINMYCLYYRLICRMFKMSILIQKAFVQIILPFLATSTFLL